VAFKFHIETNEFGGELLDRSMNLVL
jgi:hypothetical protein